jgi:D-tagatose-1,6-bisphosphate aldolase subunit GatZ/KbaZ
VTPAESLAAIVAQQKAGRARGIYSVCSINRYVIEAAMEQARADESLLLVESTCNQVNQFGGYSGLTPSDFRSSVESIAAARGFPSARLLLGGDHLGPFPFRSEGAEAAMAKAAEMVRRYVEAGVGKIHLDASMRLGGDPGSPGTTLDPRLIAARCAELCAVAEKASGGAGSRPLYVIGSDVPTPGGSDEVESAVHITTAEELAETVHLVRASFLDRGLDDAWERVVAVVVQPGVEHGDHTILEYDRDRAAPLTRAIRGVPRIVFEGHTTDYQAPRALAQMVEDGIAVLKVGPSLTGALREAVFMLGHIEEELLAQHPSREASDIIGVLDAAMRANPAHWKGHYAGDESRISFSRKYSLLDRIRYYWNVPEVEESLRRLLENLRSLSIPGSLVSQFLPEQYARVRAGVLKNDPEWLLRDRIMSVLWDYSRAVGNGPSPRLDTRAAAMNRAVASATTDPSSS